MAFQVRTIFGTFNKWAPTVIYCTESFLIELGLKKKGNLYALHLFCERDNVLRALQQRAKKASSHSNIKPRWQKFEIGWLHFSEEKGRYLAVRQSTGGRMRSVVLPRLARHPTLLTRLTTCFCPQGESTFGKWLEMD